jgi:poly-D-alanine transfer protein DltD
MYSSNNPYGIENDTWNAYYAHVLVPPKQPGSADSAYIQDLNNSPEWIDFDLALRVLKELRAQPLILSRPINGPIWDAMGVSTQARQQYYVKLQKAVLPYGFPTIDFADHDNDHYFSIDESSHTSRVGWVYIDMKLDAFFHSGIH